MKKLFTLFALLAMAIGAKAEWVEDYKIDYSTHTAFPFYVMGYVPEWIDGVMTDPGANFKFVQATEDAAETSDVIVKTEAGVEYYKIGPLDEPAWHQYFIADGIPTELDGSYTVKAMVKASEACSINVNMGWGWGDGQQASATVAIPAGDEFVEVEWQYSGIGGTSCNLVAQPGTVTATIEWKWVTVSHNQKPQRPVEWVENITNGDAEKSWAELGLADVAYNDMENNFKICAWGKEKGVNMDEAGEAWNPFPATIEQEEDGNHFFVVHGKEATTEGDASAWDNQFWIQSPKEWKSGTQLKIKFRYKASKDVTVATQVHHQTPSDYLIWHAIGDISFTTEWQTFDNTMSIADDMGGTWSIAFQLNQNDKEAIDFCFDDLSWQNMKLDEGLFIAASNTETGIEYDLDNATEFVYDEEAQAYVATVGTAGDQATWVNEVMISTVRGNDAAFKGATLKPSGAIVNDPDEWLNYTESALAKIKLPAAGVWTVSVDTENMQMNFVKVEGEEDKQPLEINPNPTVVVVNGLEREDLKDEWNDGSLNVREEADENPDDEHGLGGPGHDGQTWDNQFWIMANRALDAGESTVISFKYRASREAKTTTQDHTTPGNYLWWNALGDVNFTTDWQEFETTFVVPSQANGMQSIAFNMAEIREACMYEIKDVIWKLDDDTESLIDQEGSNNFYVKEGAGTSPHVFGGDDAVNSVVNNTAPTDTYNLAGQRVTKDYKGIVVTKGRKYLAK